MFVPRSFFVFGIFLLMGSLFAGDEPIRIAGSDILRPVLAEPLEREKNVEAIFEGSLKALEKIKSGEVDLAIVAFSGEFEALTGFEIKPLAYQVGIVVVNEDNPIESLNINQLRKIFGINQANDWGKLGLKGDWAKKTIQPMMLEASDTIALELFQHYVFHGIGQFNGDMYFTCDEEDIVKKMTEKSGAIGFLNKGNLGGGVKSLAIAGSNEDVAFHPSLENVYYGDYPLRVPFYVIYNREKVKDLKPILGYLWGDKGQQVLDSGAFYPLPKNIQKRHLEELDI